jgi:hypothetical protein
LGSSLYRLLAFARGGGERELEIVVLRHQVAILRRGDRRPQYTAADRALLAAASRLLPLERWSCFAASPQTLRRWHRARENPRWGYVRIQGELLKLGISVSATTIATVLRVSGLGPAPRRIGPSWSEFLRAQAQSMLGAGLPSQPVATLRATRRRSALHLRQRRPATWKPRGSPATLPRSHGPRFRCRAACRGCRPLPPCPLPATRPPRRCVHRGKWHARDGPRTRRRSLHARTVPTVCQSRRPHAPRRASCNHSSGSPGGRMQAFTQPRRHNGPKTGPSRN